MASDEIKLKHKVQLRKKVSEEVSPSPTPEPQRPFPKWIWACICVVILIVCCIIFIPKQKTSTTMNTVEAGTSTETLVGDSIKGNDTPVGQTVPENAQTEGSKDESESNDPSNTGTLASIPEQDTQTAQFSDVETEAKKVIRGVYGNGQERKDKLRDRYAEIQGKVNEMYRNGLVK